MVSVPVTTRRSIGVQPLGNDRLRYAAPRNFVGPAIQEFGQSLGKAAEDFDQIEATYDDANKLELQNDLMARIAETRSEFRNLRGKDPALKQEEMFGALADRAEELLSSARSERARTLARQAFAPLLSNAREFMTTHADGQMFAYKGNQLEAQAETFAENAVEARGTPEFLVNLISGEETLGKLQSHLGWSDEELTSKRRAYVSKVHRSVVESLRSEGEEGPRNAERWLNANAPEINEDDERILREGLKAPLEELQTVDDYLAVRSFVETGAPPEQAEPEPQEPGESFVFKPAMLSPRAQMGRGPKEHGYAAVDIPAPLGDPIYAPTEAEVVRVDNDPGGNEGLSVRVRLLDGSGREASFAHLSRITVKPGDKVGQQRALGAVGSTGRSTGPHIHYSVFGPDGKRVDPMGQRYGGGDGRGGQFVRHKPEIGGSESLYAAAYALAEKEGWSQGRLDRVLRRADADVSRNEALLRERENVASREAAEIIGRLGPGGLTSVSQLGEAYYRMSPQARLSYDELIRKNLEPKEPVWDPAFMLELSDQLARDPEGFANRNAADDLGRLPKGAQGTYLGWRRSAIGKPESGDVAQVSHSRIVNVSKPLLDQALPVDPGLKGKKLKEANAERAQRILQFREVMTERLAEFQRINDKAPGDDDIFKMASRVLTEIRFADGAEGFYFERPGGIPVGSVARIPNDAVAQIRGEYRSAFGREPTEAEVTRIWFRSGMTR